MPPIPVGPITFNPESDFLIIAGPCVIESLQLCLDIAGHAKEVCRALGLPYIFKGSFDKANRSSSSSFRGEGMHAGLEVLAQVRHKLNVPVTTDIHESDQAAPVAAVVDMLQIPAFLCRQTDLLVAAGQTHKPVNVKKGQFMAPWEMSNAVEKVRSTKNAHVLLTERGTFFGYNRLVNDMTSIPLMQDLHAPVLFDATHSTQLPGALGSSTGGQRQFVPLLAKSATAAGANGLFIEIHPTPEKSPSDAATILDIKEFKPLVEQCVRIREALSAK